MQRNGSYEDFVLEQQESIGSVRGDHRPLTPYRYRRDDSNVRNSTHVALKRQGRETYDIHTHGRRI